MLYLWEPQLRRKIKEANFVVLIHNVYFYVYLFYYIFCVLLRQQNTTLFCKRPKDAFI